MEMHSNVYYRHADSKVMAALDHLFESHKGNQDIFVTSAIAIHPELGEALAIDITNSVDDLEFDLGPESVDQIEGYSIAHFVHGSSGDEFIEAILLFLKALVPDIDTQAWGCGDDDPWEFWFKFEGNELIREDDEPFNDPEEDEAIKSSIYTRWHKDFPEKIKEGFLNQE